MSSSDAPKASKLAAKPKRSTQLARQAASRAAFARDVEEFIADARAVRGVSEQTACCYEIDLKQYVAWLCERGVPSARRVETEDVEAWARHLNAWRAPRRPVMARRNTYDAPPANAPPAPTAFDAAPRRYAPRSIARKLMVARAWHRFLGRTRGYPDPTQALSSQALAPVAASASEAPRALAWHHLAALLDPADDDSALEKRDRALLHLLCSGLTGGELCALRLRDFVRAQDGAQAQLRCHNLRRAALSTQRARTKRRLPATRWVPLDARTAAAVADYLQVRPLLFEIPEAPGAKAPRTTRRTTLLFIEAGGDALTLLNVRAMVREKARRAALPPGITPRVLRHAYVVRSLEDGCDLRALQGRLGHAHLAAVQTYRAAPHRLQDAYRRAHPRA